MSTVIIRVTLTYTCIYMYIHVPSCLSKSSTDLLHNHACSQPIQDSLLKQSLLKYVPGSGKVQYFEYNHLCEYGKGTCNFTNYNIINGCITKCYKLTDGTIVDAHT